MNYYVTNLRVICTKSSKLVNPKLKKFHPHTHINSPVELLTESS